MKVYIVVEDWTGRFCGLYKTKEVAEEVAKEVGGEIEEYEI